jgi:hypothetical protein
MSSAATTFRLNTPTIALFFEEGRQVAHILPEGALIHPNSVEGHGLIEVMWEGKTVQMFAQDVRERTERVTGVT